MSVKLKIIANILLLISLSILVYVFFAQSYTISLQTPTQHLDGAFQTASALFRLLHGEVIGQDFFFYLGIGPAYLLYPFFSIMGGNLASSLFVSYFIVKIIFLFSVFFLTKLSLNLSFFRTLALTLFFFLLFDVFASEFYFSYYLEPGNSLKPVRRFVPIIGALFLLLLPNIPCNKRALYLGVIGGGLALWSNDFGYFSAIFLAIYFIYEYFVYEKSIKLLLVNCFVFFITVLATYFILVSILTHGHAMDWIAYNFEGVGRNQWWYFESYTDKVFCYHEFFKIFFRKNVFLTVSINLSILLISALFVLSIIKRKITYLVFVYIGLTLFSGAFITEYFGHVSDDYWYGIYIWLLFAILSIMPASLINHHLFSASAKSAFIFSLLLISYYLIVFSSNYNKINNVLINIDKSTYNIDFHSYMNPSQLEYIKYLEEISLNGKASIVEEYTSLASILLENKSLVPFDSVIHALGKKYQELYLEKLDQYNPLYITVTNPKFSFWQAWSFTQNWWFYKYVLKNYYVEKEFPNLLVLKKNKQIKDFIKNPHLNCQIDNNNISITSDEALLSSKLIEVSAEYELNNTNKVIVLLGNDLSFKTPSTSIDTTSARNTVNFPVYINSNTTTVNSNVLPYEKRKFFILKKCSVLEVDTSDALKVKPAFQRKVVPSLQLSQDKPIKIYLSLENKDKALKRIGIIFGTYERTNPGSAILTLKKQDGSMFEKKFQLNKLVDNQYEFFELNDQSYVSGEIKSITGSGVSTYESFDKNNQASTCIIYEYQNGLVESTPGCPM